MKKIEKIESLRHDMENEKKMMEKEMEKKVDCGIIYLEIYQLEKMGK